MRRAWGWDPPSRGRDRYFVAYFWFTGWWNIQLGFHISLWSPNIEIHVPFGFFRIGWSRVHKVGITWKDVAGLLAGQIAVPDSPQARALTAND